jgi:acyl carrier protein
MTKIDSKEIYSRLTAILREVFDNDELVATPELTALDVEGWDSLGNVNLFLAIEEELGVRFSAGEIGEIQNVGQLVELIGRKL